ncbi:LIM and calponin homology domains-containing protein 1a isoform X3 [Danio aesculapii]|uniref:LIM and calponin homology domains-containing protein 1a isoform X3 n=1 Tax=Danio aesculapii TaxID=1142201 RepID=UPI0024C0C574|nr:LIM and calponin homology domains-containing protein 1a isoform X3 [Danio aesculapii]
MASSGDDSASNAQLDQAESAEATPEPAFQEAQKWIEAVTGRSFGDKDFRSGLENGILLCELLSSIKPGLVKKINRLPTPIAGLDNLTMFLRGCEEVGLKGSQLFDPGDLQDTSIRANLTGSDCSRKLKNVLITIYWLGKAANSCATYNGPTLDLKEFEGLLSMMRKECVNEESDSPKRSIRDSGYIDSWESERSDSLSPPRHGRDDSFDSLDSFGSRSQNTPSPDTVIRCNSDDSEADRKLPDVRKDDMSARRVSYKEPRAALPFNQYLPNKSNQTNYLPAPLRKRRSDREEDRRSVSNSTSPVGGERPLRQECVEVLKEGAVVSQKKVQKHFTWTVEKGAELDEAELKKMRKLEKAGIKVLPATVRYNSPIVTPAEDNKLKSPSPDIILRRDNDFMRAAVPHQWDSDEAEEDGEVEQKVPDVQKDDLASRRARMNQFKPSVAHHFLPGSCSWKDREKWEGIRMASQHAVLERIEKMEQEKLEKRSQTEPASPEVPIITRKDNPFLSLEKDRAKEGDEEDEREVERKTVTPNLHKDDLARRRTGGRPRIPKDPHQSLVQTSITQSDLETWQRLKMNTESSESDLAPAEVSIITRKENPFLTPEKQSEQETEESADREEGERVTTPNVKTDDLARRRSQSGSLPQKEPRQSLAQTTITQSDLEKWQKLKMSTDSSESDSASAEVSIIIRKENPFLTPEKQSEQETEESADREEGEKVMMPNVKTDDLARRRSQSVPLPQKEPRQSLAQTTITQSDLEKWQKLKMSTDSSDEPIVPLCQTCLEKGCLSVASKTKVAKNDPAGCWDRSSGKSRRVVTFGGVTEMESTSWKEEEEDGEDEEEGEREGNEAEKLRYLLSVAPVAVPNIGLSSRLTKRAVVSGDINPEPAPIMPPEPPNLFMFDLKRPLTSTERKVLEDELAEKAKDEKEDDEEDEAVERQPDIEKDDMLARRTRAFQKTGNGTSFNQFLPLPGSKREGAIGSSLAQKGSVLMGSSGDRDLQYLERNIRTKRTKIGQRFEPVDQVAKTPAPVAVVTQQSPDIVRSTASSTDRSATYDYCDDDDDDEYVDDGQLPDVEKDDMLARRTGSYQKPNAGAGQAFNAFLPKPGAVKHKIAPVRGSQSYVKPREHETAPSQDSFTLSSVAPPPRDAEDMPRKWPQMMDRQETGSGGQESLIKHETLTKSPSPMPEQPSRRPLWQEDDDDLPPIFRATSVSDEAESVSLIDMRDEEDELAYLRPHSQSRHEHLHNQYNKVKEEEDQWQDDLARWKNRRRSASQDLIKKEEERKMMEKLMTTDGGHGHRKKSIKTYKEIVEEKEKREQELHEQYRKASSPEEKAAVLQRYALRFTISDAILEKLQLPKLPSAASPMHTSPVHQSEQKTTSTALVEAEVPELSQTTQAQQTVHVEQKITHEAPAQPKIPKPSPPPKCIKAPEVLSAPSRVPPAPSKPVPLITPKPYSQPKFSQGFRKSLKSDGLIRVNGDHNQQEIREKTDRDSLQKPDVNFSSSSPKPAIQSQQNEEPIVLETSDHQQDLQTPKPDLEKEVINKEEESPLSPQEEISKEDTSTTLSVSEPAGKQPVPDTVMKRNFVVTTTIVTELTQTHPVPLEDTSSTEQPDTVQNTCDLSSTAESCKADQTSYSISSTEGIDYSIECIETPMLNLAKRVDHWTWDPNEERRRQERWQQEQERLLQEKYQREQEKLKEEWEKAQREVEAEERRHNEEERRILEETVTPLTPRTSVLSSSCGTEAPSLTQPSAPHETIVLSLADWERKQEMLEKQAQTSQSNGLTHSPDPVIAAAQQNGKRAEAQESQITTATPQLQFIQDGSWSCKSKGMQEDLKKTASLDRKQSPAPSQTTGMRRSVSGKKLCSSCAHPLGKGAAMIIETLGLYFHIQCFKCGVCKGLLGDTSAGTDVRIRNGLLNCQECYIKSRAAGQPTTL